METLLVEAAATGKVDSDNVKIVCDHFGDDLQQERLMRHLSVLGDICAGKQVTNISQIVENLREMRSTRSIFAEIGTLLRLYLVFPASVATAERSFSALRTMKIYLRSTMTSERLISVMVLSLNYELSCELSLNKIMHEFI